MQQQLPPLYQFGWCLQPTQSQYSQLLSLIAIHPAFKSRVNSFHLLLGDDIKPEDIIGMGALLYALLFPQLPKPIQRKLAT
jgi:hypothetical protein